MGKSRLLKYMSEPSGDISQRDKILQLPLIFSKNSGCCSWGWVDDNVIMIKHVKMLSSKQRTFKKCFQQWHNEQNMTSSPMVTTSKRKAQNRANAVIPDIKIQSKYHLVI
jgi:hypothetical protein